MSLLLTELTPSPLQPGAGSRICIRKLTLRVSKKGWTQISTALLEWADNLIRRAGQRVRMFILLVFGRAQLRPNSPRMPSGCGISTGSRKQTQMNMLDLKKKNFFCFVFKKPLKKELHPEKGRGSVSEGRAGGSA